MEHNSIRHGVTRNRDVIDALQDAVEHRVGALRLAGEVGPNRDTPQLRGRAGAVHQLLADVLVQPVGQHAGDDRLHALVVVQELAGHGDPGLDELDLVRHLGPHECGIGGCRAFRLRGGVVGIGRLNEVLDIVGAGAAWLEQILDAVVVQRRWRRLCARGLRVVIRQGHERLGLDRDVEANGPVRAAGERLQGRAVVLERGLECVVKVVGVPDPLRLGHHDVVLDDCEAALRAELRLILGRGGVDLQGKLVLALHLGERLVAGVELADLLAGQVVARIRGVALEPRGVGGPLVLELHAEFC